MVWFASCGSTSRTKADPVRINYLQQLVAEGAFEIRSDAAFPLMTQGITAVANAGLLMPGSSASRIDLIGNSNHFRVIGDSVSVNLPYYGERQMGGGYANNDTGISYEGTPQRYEIQWDEIKDRYLITMRARQGTETLQFNVMVFPSLKADINVNSTHRFSIRYSGKIVPLDTQ